MRPLPTSVSRAPCCFRSISLTGAFGSISPELDDLFTEPTEAWSASGGILQPLFQGGRLRANVARTEAVREQRKAEYARTVQSAFREVLDGLQGQRLIAGVRDANAEQVAALSRATELAELRYGQGDIAYLELARRAARPVPGADRPGRRAARCVAEHGRPGAGGRRRTRRAAEPLSAKR